MLISIFFIIVIYHLFQTTISNERKIFSFIAIFVYLIITVIDYHWLISIENYPFHPSDPSRYYLDIRGLSLKGVLAIESSNHFYFIINWFYDQIWNNAFLVSFLIKINNVLVFISAYLLMTRKAEKFTYIDVLLLFNPYAIVTLIRNVRDIYIILFVVMVIVGLDIIPNNRIKKRWFIIGGILLSVTRSVLLLIFAFIAFVKYRKRFSKTFQYSVLGVILIGCFIFFQEIMQRIASQFISAMDYMGEDIVEFLPLLSGGLNLSLFIVFIKRIIIALAVFLFTPHPVNFISDWLVNMDETGKMNIYTGLDNVLISVGAIFNYLLVIPVIISYLSHWEKSNKFIFIFVIGFIILYTVAFLGATDIRNRNTVIFFILSGIIVQNQKLRVTKLHYLCAVFIFFSIYFISN